MKILIWGGCGFIGSHIVDALWEAGIQDITVFDNFSAGRKENLIHPVNIEERDISKKADLILNINFKDYDWVINCAAQVSTFESITSPERDFNTNAQGVFVLLETLRKADYSGGFIYTSSRSIHGDLLTGTANESTGYSPSSIYNTNKYYGELLTRLYGKLYGLKYWIVRPSNVYGPRQPNSGLYNFVCRWIAYALQKKQIPIWGSGEQTRDFVYVEDIADGYRKILQNKPAQDTFLFSSGKETTLNQLAKLILYECGNPYFLKGVEYKPPKAGDIQRFVGDSSLAKTNLGWEARTDLKVGMKLTTDWVKKNIDRYKEYNL